MADRLRDRCSSKICSQRGRNRLINFGSRFPFHYRSYAIKGVHKSDIAEGAPRCPLFTHKGHSRLLAALNIAANGEVGCWQLSDGQGHVANFEFNMSILTVAVRGSCDRLDRGLSCARLALPVACFNPNVGNGAEESAPPSCTLGELSAGIVQNDWSFTKIGGNGTCFDG